MIIVTGATKGIGLSISRRLIKNGHEVFGLARNTDNLDFPNLSCDVSSYTEIKEVVKQLKQSKAEVKGLINAAGIASMNLALTTPPNISERIIGVNLLGTIFCCQLFSPLMIRNKQGSIINFSTIAVPLGLKGESVYIASKSGVEGFSRSFSREMADFNIRVNCISPGPIDTNLIKGVSAKQIEEIIKLQVIKKQFQPEDICDLTEFLLDEKSASLSGQVFNVGGV